MVSHSPEGVKQCLLRYRFLNEQEVNIQFDIKTKKKACQAKFRQYKTPPRSGGVLNTF